MKEEETYIWIIGYIKGIINTLYNQKIITTETYNDTMSAINIIEKNKKGE